MLFDLIFKKEDDTFLHNFIIVDFSFIRISSFKKAKWRNCNKKIA